MKWIWRYLKSMGANFGEVESGKLYRGAKPSKDTYRKLQAIGATTVISLIDKDAIKDRHLALSHDMEWVNLPMSDEEAPTQDTVKKFLKLLEDNSNDVFFLHCKGGRHRTSVLVAVYRVIEDGWSKSKAWDEAEDYGYYSENGHEPIKNWFFNEFDSAYYKQLKW